MSRRNNAEGSGEEAADQAVVRTFLELQLSHDRDSAGKHAVELHPRHGRVNRGKNAVELHPATPAYQPGSHCSWVPMRAVKYGTNDKHLKHAKWLRVVEFESAGEST